MVYVTRILQTFSSWPRCSRFPKAISVPWSRIESSSLLKRIVQVSGNCRFLPIPFGSPFFRREKALDWTGGTLSFVYRCCIVVVFTFTYTYFSFPFILFFLYVFFSLLLSSVYHVRTRESLAKLPPVGQAALLFRLCLSLAEPARS